MKYGNENFPVDSVFVVGPLVFISLRHAYAKPNVATWQKHRYAFITYGLQSAISLRTGIRANDKGDQQQASLPAFISAPVPQSQCPSQRKTDSTVSTKRCAAFHSLLARKIRLISPSRPMQQVHVPPLSQMAIQSNPRRPNRSVYSAAKNWFATI